MSYIDISLTTVDGAHTVADATIDLVDASEFPTAGTIKVWDAADAKVLNAVITYTGKSTNQLTGCTWNIGHTDVNLATGDFVALSLPASAVGNGAMALIERKVAAVDVASFDFTNIPQGYENLKLVITARGATAAGAVTCYLRFNGDSGTNYDWSVWDQENGFNAGTSSTGVAQISAAEFPAANANADVPGSVEITVPSYARTVFNKTMFGLSAGNTDNGAQPHQRYVSGFWRDTSAIDQITALASTGDWLAGSVATLYGIAGTPEGSPLDGDVVLIEEVIGDETGDITISSTSFVDLDTYYTLDIAAAVGDKLLITFEAQVYNDDQFEWVGIMFNVDGTNIATMPTSGLIKSLEMTTNGTDQIYASWLYTVQAGDITAGLVTVKPRVKVSAGNFTFVNDGVLGSPVFRVINLGTAINPAQYVKVYGNVAGRIGEVLHSTGTELSIWANEDHTFSDDDDIRWLSNSDIAAGTTLTVSGTQILAEYGGRLSVKYSGQAAADFNALLFARTISVGDKWRVPFGMIADRPDDFSMAGLVMSDGVGSGANIAGITFYNQTINDLLDSVEGTFTAATLPDTGTFYDRVFFVRELVLELEYSAANTFICRVGDGLNFIDWWTITPTLTPTHIGLVWSKWGTSGETIITFGKLTKHT